MSKKITINEFLPSKEYQGEIELEFRDRNGNLINKYCEPNIIKIYAKEIISHRIPFSKIWDPVAGTGSGAWVASSIDPDEEFAAKYILFGASFDENGVALDSEDTRYYTFDDVTGTFVPNRLGPGTEFGGGLINAIPLAEPGRPLKKIENQDFEQSYQPAGTPLLQDDVRAMNNILLLETTLQLEEYNGFGASASDFFTVTEVALAGGKEIDFVEDCECTPEELFLEATADGDAQLVTLSGTNVVTIDSSESEVDLIKEGDSVKLVAAGGTPSSHSELDQITPYYLVISKTAGGRDVVLDRTPVDSENTPLAGQIGIFRNSLRIFSHRILSVPFKKSEDFEILVRWRIIIN